MGEVVLIRDQPEAMANLMQRTLVRTPTQAHLRQFPKNSVALTTKLGTTGYDFGYYAECNEVSEPQKA